MFKNRAVNPVEYDSKMKFWMNLIQSSSSQYKKPSFTYNDLMQRFRRKDRLPAGLNVVIREMLTKGDIISLQDYALSGSGWLSWSLEIAVKRPLGWLFGYNQANDISKNEFVIPKVLDTLAGKELCHKVIEIRRSMQENASPTGDVRRNNIVEYKKFVKIMQPHGFDEKSLFLIIEQLRRIGLISIDHSEKGEKLIKFPDEESGDSDTVITDSDKKFYKYGIISSR
uniref:CHMP7 winged helix domain-containing protein n=1 Tax=Romanomermis culicivorax TaxID=13658 RepID=A0A915LB34_ROMCU